MASINVKRLANECDSLRKTVTPFQKEKRSIHKCRIERQAVTDRDQGNQSAKKNILCFV